MAHTQTVAPVKLIVALLWRDAAARDHAESLLVGHWGPVDVLGADHPFDATSYYESEMGAGLSRRLLSFERLVAPESLAEAKLVCNEFEQRTAAAGRRLVNLDVGYLDLSKIVLASVKYAGQKLAIGKGIYADLVARYRHGKYAPFEWTFPDFRDGRYDDELARIRERYRLQLRQGAAGEADSPENE